MVGVFPVKGRGPKSSVCPSKPRETKLFGGISRDFAGISQGHLKSLRKMFVFKSRPLTSFNKVQRGRATFVALFGGRERSMSGAQELSALQCAQGLPVHISRILDVVKISGKN